MARLRCPHASFKSAEKVTPVIAKLIDAAQNALRNEEKANFILTRGFSGLPQMPAFEDAFGLRAVAIANYPMYRGLAKLVGMDTPAIEGGVEDELNFKKNYNGYDFFLYACQKKLTLTARTAILKARRRGYPGLIRFYRRSLS